MLRFLDHVTRWVNGHAHMTLLLGIMTSLLTSADAQTMAPCTHQWLRSSDYRSATQGTQLTGSDTASQEACITACVRNTLCVSVDIRTDVSPPQCWISLTAAGAQQVVSATNYQHYVLTQRCLQIGPCRDQWQLMSGIRFSSGSRDQNSRTADACMAVCLETASCLAVDFDTANSECWVHTDVADLSQSTPADGFQQYILVTRCSVPVSEPMSSPTTAVVTGTVFCNTWTVNNSSNSMGASERPTIRTLDDCRASCVNEPDCVAVDFNKEEDSCWLHLDAANLASENTFYQRDTDQHILIRGLCLQLTTAQTTVVSSFFSRLCPVDSLCECKFTLCTTV